MEEFYHFDDVPEGGKAKTYQRLLEISKPMAFLNQNYQISSAHRHT